MKYIIEDNPNCFLSFLRNFPYINDDDYKRFTAHSVPVQKKLIKTRITQVGGAYENTRNLIGS